MALELSWEAGLEEGLWEEGLLEEALSAVVSLVEVLSVEA